MLLWDAVQTKEEGEECPNCQCFRDRELRVGNKPQYAVMLDRTLKYADKDGLSVCLSVGLSAVLF